MSPVHPLDEAATARAVIDGNGTLLRWSEGARRLLGHAPEEVEGRPAADLLATGTPVPAELTGNRWNGSLDLRHRDGHTVSVWLLAHRRRPQDGGPATWLVVTPLEARGPRSPDDPLTTAVLAQSPCPMAVYDDRLRLFGVNDAMADVIGLPESRIQGLRISEIGGKEESEALEAQLHEVLVSGTGRDVETFMQTGGEYHAHAWMARIAPLTDTEGRVRGVCLAAHDFTEQYNARERLQLVNEASVRIGTTLDVTRTAQELADVCVPALADFVRVDLLDPPEHGGEPHPEPPTAPITLRRAAHQSVNPGCPEAVVKPGQVDVYPAHSPQADSLTAGRTIVAPDDTATLAEWLSWDDVRAARIAELGLHTSMSVPIKARGQTLGVAVLTRFRHPGPFTPDDVLLAEEVTARASSVSTTPGASRASARPPSPSSAACSPSRCPRTAALEAASRYLPAARAGVGGDWFDVIPLSGMRVAMVVGDVVGHGITASATMGRLRTAVRTLADIDLAPDELLTHLDDLVVRLSTEVGCRGHHRRGRRDLPVRGVRPGLAALRPRPGLSHPPPVMLTPGGQPRQIDLPAGPPLGLGGLPFESVELALPEGTVLALFTDGLIENRERDVEANHELMCHALAESADSLEGACHTILRTLLPVGGAQDDVALLLARTHGLAPSQVATWDIPADPALVAPIRKQVVDQLDVWGLSAATFTAELVVSELVTNAIRYGEPPIRLRLIHDSETLICEVSDSSHTAPHLRRAKIYDEGGRGLLLVAQLTQRWGSRHTADGKTIWAELALLGEF
ncbi:SpoIIE family protein phosphatase [Streptomyces sp. S1D4-11]